MTDPLRTRAVVVGVERYRLGDQWDLDGAALDACRFVRWLDRHGVPPGNISLHLAPLPGNEAEVDRLVAGRLPVQPADEDRILATLLDDVAAEPSDLLILFWGGHGVWSAGITHLLCADAGRRRRNVPLDPLLKNMCTDAFPGHPRQLIIVDACRIDVSRDWPMPLPGYQPGVPVPARRQVAMVATTPGERAANDDRNRTGLFSAAVLRELTWPAEDDDFAHLWQRVTAAATTATQHPSRIVHVRNGEPDDVWEPRAAPKAAPLTDLGTYRVPPPAVRPGQRPPVDDRDRVRLDVACCLRRAPHVTVLAADAAPGYAGKLAATLTVAEDLLARHEVVDRADARSWQVLAVPPGRPPARDDELGADPAWLAATSRGAVVTGLADVRTAAEYVRAVRHLLPDVALLCLVDAVDAAGAADLADRAARLARRLELPELLIASPAPVEPRGAATPYPFPPGGALGALVTHLNAYGAKLSPPDGEPPPVPDEIDVVAWAAQVVDELNAADRPGCDESALLAAARDRRRGLYPALLAAYARNRDAPGRQDSLAVAAATDAELGFWLAHAEPLPLPRDGRLAPEVVDALAIALRRISPEAARPWAPLADPAVARLVTLPPAEAGRLYATAPADVALRANRCGLDRGVALTSLGHAAVRPGAWALLAHRGITDETAAWLAGLNDRLRPVADLLPWDRLSVADRDALSALREALHPRSSVDLAAT